MMMLLRATISRRCPHRLFKTAHVCNGLQAAGGSSMSERAVSNDARPHVAQDLRPANRPRGSPDRCATVLIQPQDAASCRMGGGRRGNVLSRSRFGLRTVAHAVVGERD